MKHTDHDEDRAATLIGALVDLGGLDALEEADEDDDDAELRVSAVARFYNTQGGHTGPIMEKVMDNA